VLNANRVDLIENVLQGLNPSGRVNGRIVSHLGW
jgi:hypothetical protein